MHILIILFDPSVALHCWVCVNHGYFFVHLVAVFLVMTGAHGTFSSKGLSMALSGLQGLSSKHPEVRLLVDALAGLMERSEATFEGFEDFHQIATALNGLQGRWSSSPSCVVSVPFLYFPFISSSPYPLSHSLLSSLLLVSLILSSHSHLSTTPFPLPYQA